VINGLDLFSGYGGISLGLRDWVRPVAYCEIERFAQAVLLSRMSNGEIERAPIWDDIRTLDGLVFEGNIDIIYGGFPCQDISVAGAGKGLGGERSGLFFEVCRLVEEIKPPFVFLENVPAIRTRGLREVVRALTDLGYDCRWTRVSAAEVGAPHLRQRWFLLAREIRNPTEKRLQVRTSESMGQPKEITKSQRPSSEVAHTNIEGLEGRDSQGLSECSSERSSGAGSSPKREPTFWEVEPDVGRVADGVALRVDRIKALGNGVVPQQVNEAFRRLIGVFDERLH
jgi:DNA (cytosine-5)-methyltransferase 1